MNKSIRDYKFEIEFGLSTNIITLKICDHFQLQSYVFDQGFTKAAISLVNSEDKCPVCGKGA